MRMALSFRQVFLTFCTTKKRKDAIMSKTFSVFMDKNMTESTQGIANLPQGIANLPQGIANLPQGMSESNIIAEIKRDHEEMKTYYTNFKNATTVEESNKWFNQFVLETSRHSVGEELVLYPLMEKLSQKGKDLADA